MFTQILMKNFQKLENINNKDLIIKRGLPSPVTVKTSCSCYYLEDSSSILVAKLKHLIFLLVIL